MKRRPLWILLFVLALSWQASSTTAAEKGFKSLFDGKTLKGWEGNPAFWSVKDGAITGQTTAENPTKGNTFLIWKGGEPANFELRMKFRIVGGNSGVQYRSKDHGDWVVGGYQADIDAEGKFAGILYEERGRGILAMRGNKVLIKSDGTKQNVGKTADEKTILDGIKKEDWNDYRIVAKGNHLIHEINGNVSVDVTDEQEAKRAMSGVIALQLHAGPPMLIQFKDIEIKNLDDKKSAQSDQDPKKVVFVAGRPSHGYGSHEHNAGCLLLARYLRDNVPGFETVVYQNGWPAEGMAAFDGADAVVVYCDGGGGHLLNAHIEYFNQLMERGVGLACIHYGVEVPKGKSGDAFLDWIGGYFETHWSVNPHWDAEFNSFPKHPITRGVKPFTINDEWYFHMRFRPEMKGVTPILSAKAPASTMSRADGPHSGNPHVRAAVQRGDLQHVAWASERPDGGRGFGFTGGHVHWNWGDDNFRKVVLNAIVWVAQGDVPTAGIGVPTPSRQELEKNQDFSKPGEKKSAKAKLPKDVKPIFSSKVITPSTPNHSVDIDVKLGNAKKLFLVIDDGGNGFSCDWADWINPRLVGPKGEQKLSEIKWKTATADWGQVRVNKNCGGQAMRVAGKSISNGIGAHATSLIEFDLPAGFNRFVAQGGLDNGGTDQPGGKDSSVRFHVFTRKPDQLAVAKKSEERTPETAVEKLDVHEQLNASLFAAEPMLLSPSNIDIDHRGRVWVCEVVNYRQHRGKRPEGDRILILEDTNGDGQADKKTVFYQGNDIDSPHGICVLGNRVIVSAGPHVLCFTDENGDDKPDKKEVWFKGISGVQHDHGIHAFLFGPDGKLYFNFGNEGKQLLTSDGEPVVDQAGNVVAANRKPYQQGMVFRCNQDLSQFETLGWNFRNNWMATVDSFGTIWQSDNDDDGNRGVRINYVMEFGNYGYRDELTGAGWQAARTGMEKDTPNRHWHLNDPGVVPNLLQTGAGSPTGITVYEGNSLPELFHGQLIHCDAGPSITRAYLVSPEGAGYRAEIADILDGKRDKWFRPSDVKVAPDGSLIVADWYDPGVGGHAMGDLGRGRLFRVTAKDADSKYEVPHFDFATPAGATAALKNPNFSVRYLAWTALHAMGAEAESNLLELWQSDISHERARALWLLGKINGRGQHYVNLASQDSDANIRIVAIRLARQLPEIDTQAVIQSLANDVSPQVRRECAIALREIQSPNKADLWTTLATQYDGEDRWYLEALGIGADQDWNDCLSTWLKTVGDQWNTAAGRNLIWRSRSVETADLLAEIIQNPATPSTEIPKYLRAFDFLPEGSRGPALLDLAFADYDQVDDSRRQLIVVEALSRLDSLDPKTRKQDEAKLSSMLDSLRGTRQFIDLIARFNLNDRYDEVATLASTRPTEAEGIEAIRMLLGKGQTQRIKNIVNGKNADQALGMLTALGNSADNRAVTILEPIIDDNSLPDDARRQSLRGMAKIRRGAESLLNMAEKERIPTELQQAAAAELNKLPWNDLRERATKVYPLSPSKDNQSLPSIRDLARQRGNAEAGMAVFREQGTCAKCHVVQEQGKQVGPDLSEIGSKLSREALLESILYPSAGISHNYEMFTLELADGNLASGVIVSQTNDAVQIKDIEAIVREFPKSEIESITKQPISLMPADLHKNLTQQELLNLIEYMTTLKAVKKQ